MRWKRVKVAKDEIDAKQEIARNQQNMLMQTSSDQESKLKRRLEKIKKAFSQFFNKLHNDDDVKEKVSFYHIEVKGNRQLNRKKVAILIVTIITVVSIIAGTSILISNNVKKAKEQEAIKIEEQKVREEIAKKKQEEEEKEAARQAKLPKLTQVGIDNMSKIYKSETKRVFLTFDDGPSTNTEAILNILKQEDIKATFFELGARVEAQPELVKKAYDEGHYIASHGYSHVYSQIYESAQNVLDEYNQSIQVIRNAIGESEYNPHLFRFPGGLPGGPYAGVKREAAQLLTDNQVLSVDWNALNGDAEGNNLSVEKLMARTDETVEGQNSVVLLMHDAQAKSTTVEALPQVISYFRDRGYEFVNFYEIIK